MSKRTIEGNRHTDACRSTLCPCYMPLAVAIHRAVDDLTAEHIPFRYDDRPVTPENAVGCRACYPGDGSWPCATRMVADDLQAALTDSSEAQP